MWLIMEQRVSWFIDCILALELGANIQKVQLLAHLFCFLCTSQNLLMSSRFEQLKFKTDREMLLKAFKDLQFHKVIIKCSKVPFCISKYTPVLIHHS